MRNSQTISNGLSQTPIHSNSSVSAIPSFHCQTSNSELGRELQLPAVSSKNMSACPTTFPITTFTTTGFAASKKGRNIVNSKRSRVSSTRDATQAINVSTVCDSSTDRLPTQSSIVGTDLSKPSVKRSRVPLGECQSLAQTLPEIHGDLIRENCTLLGESTFSSEQSRGFVIKSEPLNPDDLDDVSTHSGSMSGGTINTACDNTPVSSLDEVEQQNLKLERKRARNRVAARRCRERKISLIKALENQVAERDAQVRSLEDTLARYRAEGERLRQHVELLASSYPSLKAELFRFPFLFQSQANDEIDGSALNKRSTSLNSDLPDNASQHFT